MTLPIRTYSSIDAFKVSAKSSDLPGSLDNEVDRWFGKDGYREIPPSDFDVMLRGKGAALLYYRRSIASNLRLIARMIPVLREMLHTVLLKRSALRAAIREYEVAQGVSLAVSEATWKALTEELDSCDWSFVESQVKTRAQMNELKAAIGKVQSQLEQYASWSRQAPRKDRAQLNRIGHEIGIVVQKISASAEKADADLNAQPVSIEEQGLSHHCRRWRIERVIVRNLMRKACEAAAQEQGTTH